MNELMPQSDIIKISYNGDTPAVSARELHEFLEIETPYTKWFARMCEYGFVENTDYLVTDIFVHNSGGGKQTLIDHMISLDMAKELCMIQRTEKGKIARRYFLSVEKRWNDPVSIMARALQMADKTITDLKSLNASLALTNEIYRPKAEYFDALVDKNLLTGFRETAKELGIKERVFIKWLMHKGYIFRNNKGRLLPYADKNNGLFEVKESLNLKTSWAGIQTLITPKGRETFRLLLNNAYTNR